jgi:hypothetical protein
MRDYLLRPRYIVRCKGLSLTVGLNKFLGYLTTIGLDLICSKQICSLTIFVHGLAEDKSHRYHFIVRILFVSMTM